MFNFLQNAFNYRDNEKVNTSSVSVELSLVELQLG